MKNQILSAFVKEYAEKNRLSGGGAEQFELFAIHCVEHGFIRSGNNASDIRLAGNEFGIDGVSFVINNSLIDTVEDVDIDLPKGTDLSLNFYQTKTSTSFDYGNISKFFDAVKIFFTIDAPIEDSLTPIREAFFQSLEQAAKFKQNPTLRLFYITAGNYQKQPQFQQLIENTRQHFRSLNLFSEIEIDLVGAGRIQTYYRSSGATEKRQFSFEKRVSLPDIENITESHIGYLPAKEFLKLAIDENGDLDRGIFYDQIRDAYANSNVNDDIAATIVSGNGELFLLKNNGITVVAKERDLNGNNFFLTDYQVVNGCQTTTVLFNNMEHSNRVMVPLKLVICNDDDIRNEIIIGTNSQNPVKKEHFWALLPFMKDLEVFARNQPEDLKLFIERRQNQYRGRDVEKARIIKNNELFKSIVSVLEFESRAGRDYASVVKEYSESLFEDTDHVQAYHLAAYIFYRVEFLWRNQKIDRAAKIFRFFILSSIGMVLFDQKKLLTLNKKERKAYCDRAIEIVADDKVFLEVVQKILAAISRTYNLDHIETKLLRDKLRSDSAAALIRTEVLKENYGLINLRE